MTGAGTVRMIRGMKREFPEVPLVGIGAIIIAPICYAILGFIGGLIGAVVYNFAANMMGGIEIEAI